MTMNESHARHSILGLLVSACLALTTGAADLPSSNYNAPSHYTFSQHISVDPATILDESPETTIEPEETESPSVVESSLMYSGGFLVSSQAMMISGGESFFSNSLAAQWVDSDFDEDEEDDDDDDDDDGHSSMLSNASLQRSRVTTSGLSRRPAAPQSPGYQTSHDQIQRNVLPTNLQMSKALMVRGGAASNLGSEFAKRLLVAALVTLVYEACMGHFLEFVKIVMQTSPPGTTYVDVVKLITAEKGIGGIWDGFMPWGVIQSIFKGGVFGLAHAMATSFLTPYADDGTIPKQLALTLAGGIGGGFQGFVLSPTLLLKTRVMTNPVFREKMSLLRTTLLSLRIGFEVVRNEGLLALMKGSGVFATKRVFDWATRFYFSDIFERLMASQKGDTLTATEKIIASLLGGTASTVATLPLDVLVAKTQDAKKAGVKVSPLKMFLDDLNKGFGWLRNAYLKGFEVRLAHVCFTTVAMKTGAPLMYDALFGARQT